MPQKKIILFTPYPPTMGGGSQNLRCALPHLGPDLDITWAYLGHKKVDYPNSIHLGQSPFDTSFIRSLIVGVQLSTGTSHPFVQKITDTLLDLQADRYWVVAHYEGLAIAQALQQARASVHLSVHDDPPGALFGRSRRYWLLQGLCEGQFARVLRGSHSIDVTSHPMGAMYKLRYGVDSVAYFPYVQRLQPQVPPVGGGVLRAGFAGTLYTRDQARIFAAGLQLAGKRLSMPVEWHLWGLGSRQQQWLQGLDIPTFCHPFVGEDDLPAHLQQTDFLYVGYPFDAHSRIFRQTSHPAKLSTYLKAQRPMFAHTPMPSSLGDYIANTNTGIVCPSYSSDGVASGITTLLSLPIGPDQYADARTRWYGEENLARLRNALVNTP